MTAEQLNIKINLDISDVSKGAKKVKDALSGVADKAKQSLPRVSKESKTAKDALGGVGDAGKKVQSKLKDIGTQARNSIGEIVTQSRKATQALKDIKTDNKFSFGFDAESTYEATDDMNNSLGELQSTMQSIRSLDFANIVVSNFGKIKSIVSKLTSDFVELPKEAFKSIKKATSELKGSFDWMGQLIKQMNRNISELKDDKKRTKFTIFSDEEAKRAIKNIKEVRKQLAKTGIKTFAQDFKKSIGVAIKSLGGLFTSIKQITLLAGKMFVALSGAIALAGFGIANSTKQYREAQSKLVSAFQSSGSSAEQAGQTYNNLFRFLGQSDKAVEAANHLAKLTNDTKNLAEWTTICQGIYATFGDSLAIEGLTEAANETARVGKVTGTLADALNWCGISEDAMNAALEKTTSLSEREALIRKTLNGAYQDAARIYEQNNKQIIAQNEAQARLDATMARIGQQTQVLVTSWINFKNVLMTAVAPAIMYISAIFSVLIDKLSQFIKWLGSLFGISFDTGNISGIVSGVGSGLDNAIGSADGLKDSLDAATGAAEKLKRTTMGFDELNIVSNPNTSSGGTGTDISTGVGDVTSGLTTGNGILSQMGEQIELIKGKVEEFFDKWKTQIAIIGGALGALGVAGLLEGLGKALGLGDKFLKTMQTIKRLAAGVITIVLQYTLMSEFLQNYIDGKGFKEYLKAALVGAIGTGILYALWGTTGLVIGLGVTAVASLKTVFDNGGITNIESAVVALTGLAAAIGAVAIALKSLGFGKVLADFGAFFALLKEGNGLIPTLAAAFPKLANVISGITASFVSFGGAIKGALAAIGGLVGGGVTAGLAIVAAAIALVTSAAVFLKNNWDAVTKAFRDFWADNIIPKFESMKKAIADAIPPSVLETIKNIGKAIADVVKAIVDWVKQCDLLKTIGKLFEGLGGIVVAVLGGTICGAIELVVGAIEGAVKFLTGIVKTISGLITAIVKLFTGDLQGAGKAFKTMVDGIVQCAESMYKLTVGVVVDFVKGVIKWFTELWDELVGHSIVPDMVEAIIKWFKKLPEVILGVIKDFVKNILNAFKNLWNDTKTWFNSNVAPKFTKSYWTGKFDSIRAGASEKLNAAKTVITDTWNSIKSWFSTNVAPKFTASFWSNKFSSIKDGARAAFNGVISVIESAINGIIRKLNTISWTIPDWVPVYGGDRFGFNLRTISIPRLAEGGIVTSSTLANIGERGKEAVLPLENNTDWMDTLADKIASRNQTPTKIVLTVDGRELGWASINNINNITKQTGGLKLHIV